MVSTLEAYVKDVDLMSKRELRAYYRQGKGGVRLTEFALDIGGQDIERIGEDVVRLVCQHETYMLYVSIRGWELHGKEGYTYWKAGRSYPAIMKEFYKACAMLRVGR